MSIETVSLILVIIVGIFSSITAPLMLAHRTEKIHVRDRQADWQRQDEVAARAVEAAQLLLANNERVAAQQQVTNKKLDVIHVLVNSNMTAAMQGEMDATQRELAMMKEVMDLKTAAGLSPTVEAAAAMEGAREKIRELAAALVDRAAAAAEVAKLNPGPGVILVKTTVTPGYEDEDEPGTGSESEDA